MRLVESVSENPPKTFWRVRETLFYNVFLMPLLDSIIIFFNRFLDVGDGVVGDGALCWKANFRMVCLYSILLFLLIRTQHSPDGIRFSFLSFHSPLYNYIVIYGRIFHDSRHTLPV
jgi:hypothetical protein